MYGALDIDEPLPAAWRSGGSSQQHIVVLAGLSREAREKRLRKYQLATVGFLVMAVSMGFVATLNSRPLRESLASRGDDTRGGGTGTLSPSAQQQQQQQQQQQPVPQGKKAKKKAKSKKQKKKN